MMMLWSVAKLGLHDDKLSALSMCSPEWQERHFGKEHIDFFKQRWSERTVLRVEQGFFECGLRCPS